MAFRPQKICLENFAYTRYAEVAFPEYGMVLIRGVNDCSHGKLDSSGSGKTALGEALSRTCFGVLGRYTDYGHFSNDYAGNKNTLVEVSGTLDGQPIAIRSGYKHPELSASGEGLAYRMGDGEWISRGHIDKTREELEKLLKVTTQVASWTVYIDGDKLNFSGIKQEDLVDLVLASLNQPPWLTYAEKARKFFTRVNTELSIHEDELNRKKSNLTEAKAAVEDRVNVYNTEKKAYDQRVKAAKEAVSAIQEEIAELDRREKALLSDNKDLTAQIKTAEETQAQKFKKFESEKLEAKESLGTAQELYDKAVENTATARAEARSITRQLEDLAELPDTCPTCKKPMDRAHEKEERGRLNALLKPAKAAQAAAEAALEAATKTVEACEDKIDALDSKMAAQRADTTRSLSEQYSKNERELRTIANTRVDLNNELREAGAVDESKMIRAKERLEAAREDVKDAEDDVQAASDKCASFRKDAAIAKYLRQAFGPTGIPNMVLSEALTPLNESSKIVGARMTGNTISVQYSAQRELASGKEKAQLIIKVDNKFGGKRLKGNSKGESGLTNLIIAETIAEMSNVSARCAYRWYDEVLRNPDETMRRNLFSYIADMAKRKKMLCFIVDHDAVAANYADYVLIAHKTAKGTTYHWD